MCQVTLSEPRRSPGYTQDWVLGGSVSLGNFQKKGYEKVTLEAQLAKGRYRDV